MKVLTEQQFEFSQVSEAESKKSISDIVDQLMEDFRASYDESKENKPYQAIEGEMRAKMGAAFFGLGERFVKGYSILLNDVVQTKPNFLPYLIDKEVLAKIEQEGAIEKKLEEGMSPFELFGLSQDALSTFYTTALYLLEHNKYEEAGQAFFCLSLLCPPNGNFLARIGQKRGRFRSHGRSYWRV